LAFCSPAFRRPVQEGGTSFPPILRLGEAVYLVRRSGFVFVLLLELLLERECGVRCGASSTRRRGRTGDGSESSPPGMLKTAPPSRPRSKVFRIPSIFLRVCTADETPPILLSLLLFITPLRPGESKIKSKIKSRSKKHGALP
jgi:hypothetical protein